jgi:uncharacterized protein
MQNNPLLKYIIAAVAIIASAVVFSSAIKNRNVKMDNISVTGLGTKDFTSDEISWGGSFEARASDPKEAYAIITADKEKVKAFFKSKGFTDAEITLGGVSFEKQYRTITTEGENNNTRSEQIFDGYLARQGVSFFCQKNPALMKKIENVIDQTAELINQGIQFNPSAVQYTYSALPSLKHSLIEAATQDAKERAQKIVKTANGDLGKLKDATMGVFQISGKGSVEEDSYGGNFDTYSKEKTARITVRLEYVLD